MRMSGAIATSVKFPSVPGNRSSPCPISMTFSTRFPLVELTAFSKISESTFAFPVFLNAKFHLQVIDFVNHHFRSSCAFSSSRQVYYFITAFLLCWLYGRINFTFVDSIVTLINQTCCRILVQSLDSPQFLRGNLQLIPFTFLPSLLYFRTVLSIALVALPWSLHNRDLHTSDFPVHRFLLDSYLCSPARQLHIVFSVAVGGCCHQVLKDVQVTQVTV